MKQLLNKVLGWLLVSNRPKHLICGIIIYTAMLVISLLAGVSLIPSCIVSLAATCIAACSVDYKDKLYGNKFDWLDVLATVLIPIIITSIFILIKLYI